MILLTTIKTVEILDCLKVFCGGSGGFFFYGHIKWMSSNINCIHSSFDADLAFGGLITSLHSAFTFSKVKTQLVPFLLVDLIFFFPKQKSTFTKSQGMFLLDLAWPEKIVQVFFLFPYTCHSHLRLPSNIMSGFLHHIRPTPLHQQNNPHQAADI